MIPQYVPVVTKAHAKAVYKQMLSGWVGPGDAVKRFEERLCEITGAKHVITVNSGTTALMVSIQVLELFQYRTILFPAYTFLAGAHAARMLSHPIKLVDINKSTLCMEPSRMVLTKDVGCVIFVNHNGYVGDDIARVKGMCKNYGIFTIEDSAQALGIPYAGRTGDIGILSFSVPKIITVGQGGAIMTDSDKLADRCRRLIDHGGAGWRIDKIHKHVGVNYRLTDIQAAYGLAQLKELPKLLAKRKQVQDWYVEGGVKLQNWDPERKQSTWMCIYRSPIQAKLRDELSKRKVGTAAYYRPINHNYTFYNDGEYPEAERAWTQLLYLPSSLNLTRKQVVKICKDIKEIEGRETN